MKVRAAVGALLAAVLGSALAQAPAVTPKVPPPTPDCGSVVIVKCERPEADDAQRARREATLRIENRRGGSAVDVMDRVIIEDDAIRPDSPEAAINRALSRPLVRQGENSFSIGEVGAVHVHEHLPAAALSLLPVHRPRRQPAQHCARLGADTLTAARERMALPRHAGT